LFCFILRSFSMTRLRFGCDLADQSLRLLAAKVMAAAAAAAAAVWRRRRRRRRQFVLR